MRKKVLYLLIMSVLFSILSGCSSENQGEGKEKVEINEDNTEKEVEAIATKEYLMELFLVTEEDLEGIPIDEILSYFNMTEKNLREIKQEMKIGASIITNLKLLQSVMEEEKKIKEEYGTIDYTYILEAKEYEGELPDIDSIRCLVDAYNRGDGGYSCVIDFEKDKVYYNPYNAGVYDDIRFAENVIDLTPELKEEIISLLKEVKLEEWNYKYDAYRGEGSVECFWEFGVEFNDGTIVSNFGVYGDSPNEYVTLRDELYDKILKDN